MDNDSDKEPGEDGASVAPSASRKGWEFARSHLVNLLALTFVTLALLAPGISSLPLTDRDEALYVQASHQMLETGDWVDIRFQDEPRYKKPVGIYWIQAATAELSGYAADAPLWVYRLPSLIGAVLMVLFTYGIGATLGTTRAGLFAGLLSASTMLIGFEARIAKTDAMLCATVLAAEFALARAYVDQARAKSFPRNALFWTAMGIGILIKGPITPLVAGLTILAVSARERSTTLWRSLSPLKGIVWMLLLALPWLIAIGWISGGAFFTQAVGRDMLGKVASGQESHGAPPGVHLLVALGTFWPLSVLAPLAVVQAWKTRREPAIFFLIAWALPGWIVFEAVATKLPNYVLPFMPALAVLIGLLLDGGGLGVARRGWRVSVAFLAVGSLLVAFGLNVAFLIYQGYASWQGLVGAVVVGGLGFMASRLLASGRLGAGLAATIAASGGLMLLGYVILLPAARQIWLSDDLADAVAATRQCEAPAISIVGYGEPSTVFRLGTGILRTGASGAAESFRTHECAVAIVAEEAKGEFLTALGDAKAAPEPAATIKGRNLNGMKLRTMLLFSKP
ncbi:glycosyltransferase family 39 protein [Pleomorphomonas sp. NRK KF1]|uniref:ArnT family glycosyltransferase n=1 Tax=Pleomorphomonas sp. NRK KF1 TaxID=2943000 RepID=UPI002043F30B|nr:glycosyltransferase family 39 protein [Pleomorphomonas sp. NRK KF1]MCM5552168.1 glycosyltransferase family 39 protein [Pleomorphomonas sp. NRK KF1]